MYNHLTMCKQMTTVKLLMLHSNTWNHFTMCKQMIKTKQNYSCYIAILETIKRWAKKWALACLKMLPINYLFTNHIYLIYMQTRFSIK